MFCEEDKIDMKSTCNVGCVIFHYDFHMNKDFYLFY